MAASLVVAACEDGSSPSTSTTSRIDATVPLLRVLESGRDDAQWLRLQVEFHVPMLMSDGTLYTRWEPSTTVYRRLLVETVGPQRMAEIRRAIGATGLAGIDRQDLENETDDADYLVTTLVYRDGEVVNRLSVPDLAGGDDARQDRVGAVARLMSLLEPSDKAAGFVPESLSVYAQQSRELDFRRQRESWPLPVSFDEMPPVDRSEFGRWRCVVIEGDEVAATIEQFSDADSSTLWGAASGQDFDIVVRPDLPTDQPCTGVPTLPSLMDRAYPFSEEGMHGARSWYLGRRQPTRVEPVDGLMADGRQHTEGAAGDLC